MTKTLLITDDAMIIREMIKDAAQEKGWTIVGEAMNGQEAIELHEKLNPDVMTLDLVMPKFDGQYALRGIIKNNPDAKILVISALDQVEAFKEAFRNGASDFIIKPFDTDRILTALDALNSLRLVSA